MRISMKVIGSASQEFSIDVDCQTNVKVLKEMVSSKVKTSVDQVKLVFKGRTLLDNKNLSDYKLSEDAKLHVVLKKPSKEKEIFLKKPKYQPEDFWRKLEEILTNQYAPNTAFDIMSQFRMDYNNLLTTMSLDDIERIGKRKLAD